METRVLRSWMAWIFAAALLGLQPGVGAQQEEDGFEAAGEAEGHDEGAFEARRRAAVAPQDQMAEARRIEQRGERISRRVQSMLDEARREKDIIRVTCLNDKLTQINTNLRTLRDRVAALEAAIDSGDTDKRNHQFTVVTVLGQKFATLEQEANQCIGQDVFETGATRVVVDVDPTTPSEQPEQLTLPVDAIIVADVPPPASGIL